MNGAFVAMTLAFALGSAAVLFVLLRAARSSRASVVRIAAATAVVIVLILSPGLFDYVLTAMNRTRGLARAMIDPSWFVKVTPGLLGLLIAAGITRLSSRRRPKH